MCVCLLRSCTVKIAIEYLKEIHVLFKHTHTKKSFDCAIYVHNLLHAVHCQLRKKGANCP